MDILTTFLLSRGALVLHPCQVFWPWDLWSKRRGRTMVHERNSHGVECNHQESRSSEKRLLILLSGERVRFKAQFSKLFWLWWYFGKSLSQLYQDWSERVYTQHSRLLERFRNCIRNWRAGSNHSGRKWVETGGWREGEAMVEVIGG